MRGDGGGAAPLLPERASVLPDTLGGHWMQPGAHPESAPMFTSTIVHSAQSPAFNSGDESYNTQFNTGAEDEGVVMSLCITLGVSLLSFLLYLWLRRYEVVVRNVYAPQAATRRGSAGFPGWFGWLAEVRDDAAAVRGGAVGLEAAMLLRYIRHLLRLLGYMAVLGLALVPFYASQPASSSALLSLTPEEERNCSSSRPDPQLCAYEWSALQTVSISHVPERSWRLVAAAVAALLFSLCYVYELTCARTPSSSCAPSRPSPPSRAPPTSRP